MLHITRSLPIGKALIALTGVAALIGCILLTLDVGGSNGSVRTEPLRSILIQIPKGWTREEVGTASTTAYANAGTARSRGDQDRCDALIRKEFGASLASEVLTARRSLFEEQVTKVRWRDRSSAYLALAHIDKVCGLMTPMVAYSSNSAIMDREWQKKLHGLSAIVVAASGHESYSVGVEILRNQYLATMVLSPVSALTTTLLLSAAKRL
jgi:hypothetical protein